MSFKEAFTDFLDSKGLKYQDVNERTVKLTWESKVSAAGLRVVVYFAEENRNNAHFICNGFCSVPDEKQVDLMVVCNALNKQYRWFKFYVDDDGDVMVEDDAILSMDNVGDECLELIVRMVNVVDEVYPVFMKAIWA